VGLQLPQPTPAGTYTNATSPLTVTIGGETRLGNPADDTLAVLGAPRLSKSFTDDPVLPGGTVTLEFTLTHDAAASVDATAIAFTDDLDAALTGLMATGLPVNDVCGSGSSLSGTGNLPAGIPVAATPNATTTCTGGTLTAAAGTGVISYTGGTVAAGVSCTVQADVSAGTIGMFANTSGDLTSSSGNSGTASDTLTVNPLPGVDGDGDGDGVGDSIENGAPNGGDGNNDMLPDFQQSDVTSLPGLNGEYVTLVSSPSVLMNVSVGPPPVGQPGGLAFPWGFFSYTLDDLLPGGIANVSMIVHTANNPVSFWKSGPEPGIPGDHYYEFLFDGTTGATLAGNVISLRFVDAQRGDDNVLTIDGLMMEPGGPALLGASVPSLQQWALLLLGLMGAAGLYSLSRRAI